MEGEGTATLSLRNYMLTASLLFSLFTIFTGYPIYDASCVALETVRTWLEEDADDGKINADLVIWDRERCFFSFLERERMQNLPCWIFLVVFTGRVIFLRGGYLAMVWHPILGREEIHLIALCNGNQISPSCMGHLASMQAY